MVRQAHTYLVGAMGGATLVVIAIAAFVMLVSTQVFTNWPIAGFGGDDEAGVSASQPVEPSSAAGAGAASAAGATAASPDRAQQQTGAQGDGRTQVGENAAGLQSGSGAEVPSGGGSDGSPSGQGSPGTTTTNPASGGGASGSGAGGAGSSGGGGAASSPSQTVTSTVNDTVTKVDETVLGGALGGTGVTEVTQGVVEGVAGPESTVGKVVDGAVGTVGGLLGGKR